MDRIRYQWCFLEFQWFWDIHRVLCIYTSWWFIWIPDFWNPLRLVYARFFSSFGSKKKQKDGHFCFMHSKMKHFLCFSHFFFVKTKKFFFWSPRDMLVRFWIFLKMPFFVDFSNLPKAAINIFLSFFAFFNFLICEKSSKFTTFWRFWEYSVIKYLAIWTGGHGNKNGINAIIRKTRYKIIWAQKSQEVWKSF